MEATSSNRQNMIGQQRALEDYDFDDLEENSIMDTAPSKLERWLMKYCGLIETDSQDVAEYLVHELQIYSVERLHKRLQEEKDLLGMIDITGDILARIKKALKAKYSKPLRKLSAEEVGIILANHTCELGLSAFEVCNLTGDCLAMVDNMQDLELLGLSAESNLQGLLDCIDEWKREGVARALLKERAVNSKNTTRSSYHQSRRQLDPGSLRVCEQAIVQGISQITPLPAVPPRHCAQAAYVGAGIPQQGQTPRESYQEYPCRIELNDLDDGASANGSVDSSFNTAQPGNSSSAADTGTLPSCVDNYGGDDRASVASVACSSSHLSERINLGWAVGPVPGASANFGSAQLNSGTSRSYTAVKHTTSGFNEPTPAGREPAQRQTQGHPHEDQEESLLEIFTLDTCEERDATVSPRTLNCNAPAALLRALERPARLSPWDNQTLCNHVMDYAAAALQQEQQQEQEQRQSQYERKSQRVHCQEAARNGRHGAYAGPSGSGASGVCGGGGEREEMKTSEGLSPLLGWDECSAKSHSTETTPNRSSHGDSSSSGGGGASSKNRPHHGLRFCDTPTTRSEEPSRNSRRVLLHHSAGHTVATSTTGSIGLPAPLTGRSMVSVDSSITMNFQPATAWDGPITPAAAAAAASFPVGREIRGPYAAGTAPGGGGCGGLIMKDRTFEGKNFLPRSSTLRNGTLQLLISSQQFQTPLACPSYRQLRYARHPQHQEGTADGEYGEEEEKKEDEGEKVEEEAMSRDDSTRALFVGHPGQIMAEVALYAVGVLARSNEHNITHFASRCCVDLVVRVVKRFGGVLPPSSGEWFVCARHVAVCRLPTWGHAWVQPQACSLPMQHCDRHATLSRTEKHPGGGIRLYGAD